MSAEAKLAELGLALPDPPPPAAAYVPWTRTGSLVFVSGQVPVRDGEPRLGLVGAELTQEQGSEEARWCAINALAVLRSAAGSLDRVRHVLKLTVFVASAPGFRGQSLVANGASELIADVFGLPGHHARSAVGVAELPFGFAVEVDLIAEIAPAEPGKA